MDRDKLVYNPPLPTSLQPISITKTLLIVPTKNERDPPLFTGKLLIKFQNILRNITQVIIRHTGRTARFSKKSLWAYVGEITKMSLKFELSEKNRTRCFR
jgi:hypothetical protein